MKRDHDAAYDSTPKRDEALQRFAEGVRTGEDRGVTAAELKDLVATGYVDEHRNYSVGAKKSYDLSFLGSARLNNIQAEAAQKASAAKIRRFVVDLQSHLHALGDAAQIDTNGDGAFGEYLRRFDKHKWRHFITVKDPFNKVSTRVEIKERGMGNGGGVSCMPIPKGVFDVLAGGYGGQRFGSRKGTLPVAEIAAWLDKRIKHLIHQKLGDEAIRQAAEASQERVDELHRELGIGVDDGNWSYDPGLAHLVVAGDGEHFKLDLDDPELTFEQAEKLLRLCREMGL